jgi:hypothetical protein
MRTPHKHAELIKAWADGAEIQFRYNANIPWSDVKGVCGWDVDCEFRIKPEPKPDVRAWFKTGNINRAMANLGASVGVILSERENANLMLTYDGETGELKAAEVL